MCDCVCVCLLEIHFPEMASQFTHTHTHTHTHIHTHTHTQRATTQKNCIHTAQHGLPFAFHKSPSITESFVSVCVCVCVCVCPHEVWASLLTNVTSMRSLSPCEA